MTAGKETYRGRGKQFLLVADQCLLEEGGRRGESAMELFQEEKGREQGLRCSDVTCPRPCQPKVVVVEGRWVSSARSIFEIQTSGGK